MCKVTTFFNFPQNFSCSNLTNAKSFCFIFHVVVYTALSLLAANGEAAWRRRGGHYRLLEPQTVNSSRKVIRSYTPACTNLAKRSHEVNRLLHAGIFYSFSFKLFLPNRRNKPINILTLQLMVCPSI